MKVFRHSWMQPQHVPAVLEIERSVFADPWDHDALMLHVSHPSVRELIVSPSNSSIPIGFIVYYLGPHQVEILNIAIRPQFQNQGIGTAMVNHLIENLGTERHQVIVDVCESFALAQSFFRSCGFRADRLFRNHHGDHGAYRFAFDRDFSSPVRRSTSKKATL